MSRFDKFGGKSGGKSGAKFGGKFGADFGDDPFAGQDPFAGVPDVDERLADWVDETMSPRDRERFEAEMRVSPHLREQVADYEATVASIRDALNDETHETNLADRVMASLAQEATGAAKPKRSGWPMVWAVMSAAALLGIAVLIDS
ncbi:MAG: anti-sigma factor RsiW, partial [Planctomycetota bacterium]